jgi:hypothetical protein
MQVQCPSSLATTIKLRMPRKHGGCSPSTLDSRVSLLEAPIPKGSLQRILNI